MHPVLRHAAERALRVTGVAAASRRRRRGDTLILAYHNVVPADEPRRGDVSLHLPLSDFRAQLDALQETHEVVPLEDALAPGTGTGRPRAAITFDDAYWGALNAGLPELIRRGLSATVFVAPGLLGRYPWWDVLSGPIDPRTGRGAGLSAEVRRHALDALRGEGGAILEWAGRQGDREGDWDLGPFLRIATETQLTVALQAPGVSAGSHTWSHSNLLMLDRAEIDREVADSMAWLRDRLPRVVPWLSYPYGCFSADAEAAAGAGGLVGALRVDGGWVRSADRPAPYAVPRFNVPAGISLDGFLLRLSGLGA